MDMQDVVALAKLIEKQSIHIMPKIVPPNLVLQITKKEATILDLLIF